jgi:hypothetical protein
MASPVFLDESRVIEALRKSGGILAGAAKLLGVSRENVSYHVNTKPHLRAIVTEIREEVKDIAELGLLQAIRAGEEWAIKFYLSRQARDRGYGSALWIQAGPNPAIEADNVRQLKTLTVEQLEQIEHWHLEAKVNEPDARAEAAG